MENKPERQLDVVLFVNGRPLAIIELKNAALQLPNLTRTRWPMRKGG